MNRKDRRKMEKEAINNALKPATQGLGVAGIEPDKNEMFQPQVMSSGDPQLYSDWFEIRGGVGSVLTICFAARLPSKDRNIVKETVTVTLPNEIAVDLMEKLQMAYPKKEEK